MFSPRAAMIARAPGSVKHKSSSLPAPSPACEAGNGGPNSSALGGRAVWAGDQLKQVAVRVVEIDAAATIEMIDLAGTLAAEIRVVLHPGGADAGEGGIEFRVADQESIVLRAEALGVGKIESDPVARLDRNEVAPCWSRLQVQDVGEELGGSPFVLRRDDRVVQLDTHLSSPSSKADYCTRSASRDR